MEYIPLSFLAGILTILAPCVFTFLPVTLGSASIAGEKDKKKPFIVIFSLLISIFIFTLLLKATTAFIGIPEWLLPLISGTIIVLFGLVTLFPEVWDKLSYKAQLSSKSDGLFHQASNRQDTLGHILLGFSLGPVFSSCSPTYSLVVATVLPNNTVEGLANIVAYLLGLAAILIPIALIGQAAVNKLKWASNPRGKFKIFIGLLFVVIGILIIFRIDKEIQSYILEQQDFTELIEFEVDLLRKV